MAQDEATVSANVGSSDASSCEREISLVTAPPMVMSSLLSQAATNVIAPPIASSAMIATSKHFKVAICRTKEARQQRKNAKVPTGKSVRCVVDNAKRKWKHRDKHKTQIVKERAFLFQNIQ